MEASNPAEETIDSCGFASGVRFGESHVRAECASGFHGVPLHRFLWNIPRKKRFLMEMLLWMMGKLMQNITQVCLRIQAMLSGRLQIGQEDGGETGAPFGVAAIIVFSTQGAKRSSLSARLLFIGTWGKSETRAALLVVWTVDDPELLRMMAGIFPPIRVATNYPEHLILIINNEIEEPMTIIE